MDIKCIEDGAETHGMISVPGNLSSQHKLCTSICHA